MIVQKAAVSGKESLIWLDYLDVRDGVHDPDPQYVRGHIETWGTPPQLREDLIDQGRRIIYERAAALVFAKNGLSDHKNFISMARRFNSASTALADAERLLAGYLKAATCRTYGALAGDDARIFVTIAAAWFVHRGMQPDECITDPLYTEEAHAIADLLERREIAQ